jgi:(p)ppGpp synthase/HD superfamily hydrolase
VNDTPTREDWAGLVEKAVVIAVSAHQGQRDKVGQPYILHPLRLLHRANGPEERIVAVLHDVLEDSEVTPALLEEAGFPAVTLVALALVTKLPEEEADYERFIERIATAPGRAGEIARAVKRLDLADNMDVLRLPEITDRDAERLRRYRKAYARLG